MSNLEEYLSESDSDELDWSSKKSLVLKAEKLSHPKTLPIHECSTSTTRTCVSEKEIVLEKKKKFEELRSKAETIRDISTRRLKFVEERKAQRLVKKALKNPYIKELVDAETLDSFPNNEHLNIEKEKKEWSEVKPFLNVNSHLQGPVSHGDWGPKTELECIIDDAIKGGDFEKAELLSDTLANKEFAGKICKAYSAKRHHESTEKQKERELAKQKKKLRWTFETKEKWQMKGNM